VNRYCLDEFTGLVRSVSYLVQRGVPPETAQRLTERFVQQAKVLKDIGSNLQLPVSAHFVPGRIEVVGKHTDYAGGRTVVAAADRGFCSLAIPRQDARIRIVDARRGDEACFPLDAELEVAVGHWTNYPMTVARRVARNFGGPLTGMDLVFTSDLPPAAGMSSSSAMIVMVFLALAEINRLSENPDFRRNIHDRTELAGYLGTIENGQTFGTLIGDRGVGTFGGSEDHTAILCARPGHLAQFSYCPVRFERDIAVSDEYLFAIGVSGVVAEKTGDAMHRYNQASRRAAVVAEIWRQATGRADEHLAAAVASAPEAAAQLRAILKNARHAEFDVQDLLDRFDQFLIENGEVIPQLPNDVSSATIEKFGQLCDRSQEAGYQLLGNQIPQTVFLAHAARRLGASAASAFGAGFGGSVWALVPEATASDFVGQWRTAYCQQFSDQETEARFFTTAAGPPAFSLSAPLPFGDHREG
jgi:galactokinase